MKKLFERLIVLTMAALLASCASPHNYKPASGYVPDAETAVKIAVAVWEPIYGKETIAGEKPYQAKLVKGVWIVEGSLPEGWKGGVALAEISKDNGKVLRISHGK
jgi:hypothetical protein